MYNITGSIRRALISAKADDRSEFLQFLLLAVVIIPPKIPGSGQSGSAPKSNGLLLVRHPTPSTPNTFIKIRRYLLEISENSYKSPSRDGKNSILDPHGGPDHHQNPSVRCWSYNSPLHRITSESRQQLFELSC